VTGVQWPAVEREGVAKAGSSLVRMGVGQVTRYDYVGLPPVAGTVSEL